MQLETLLTLLAEERNRRGKNSPPKLLLKKQGVNALRFKGISDEEIVEHLIPRLIQWEIDGDFSKENLEMFLKTCPYIHIFPAPICHEIDKTIEQRRMDSLSRLLSVNHNITPCVAVAFYENQFIIASNSPTGKTDQELAAFFVQKIAAIREFLQELAKDVDTTQNAETITHIQFSMHTRLLADKTIRRLTDKHYGGVGGLLPKDNPKRATTDEHLMNALFKLGHSYLLGLYTNGKKGFTQEDMRTLFSAPITVITPNKIGARKAKLHAEQAIIYYLTNVLNFETKISPRKVNIGISKLCCQACATVLARRSEKVAFRGSHGVGFADILE